MSGGAFERGLRGCLHAVRRGLNLIFGMASLHKHTGGVRAFHPDLIHGLRVHGGIVSDLIPVQGYGIFRSPLTSPSS